MGLHVDHASEENAISANQRIVLQRPRRTVFAGESTVK
jgi:hypothetical protein